MGSYCGEAVRRTGRGSAIRDPQLYGRLPGIEASWTVIGVALALRGDGVMAYVEHSGTGRVGREREQPDVWAHSLTNGLLGISAQ